MRATRKHHRNSGDHPVEISNRRDIQAYGSDVDEIASRAVRAGAVEPLTWVGIGETGMVFCDANGVAWKVVRRRDFKPYYDSLAAEAEWLAAASRVPDVSKYVAKFRAWHPREGVLERECPVPRERWQFNETRLLNLHNRIGAIMGQFGWTTPEWKVNSWVVTARGPKLVDAGETRRIGYRYARYVADVLAGRRDAENVDQSQSVAWGLRFDAERKQIPAAVAERLARKAEAFKFPRDARTNRGRK